MHRHLVLVGLMGSGKTTIGSKLAARLGRPLRDSDRDIEAAMGLTGRELAARDGIEALHELEREHLLSALADPTPSVIAAAASCLDDPTCIAALQAPDVRTVWLNGRPEILAGRRRRNDHRPDFGPDVVGVIRDQLEQRGEALAAVADDVVDIEHERPRRIVDRLLD